jgi:hypothetical protein
MESGAESDGLLTLEEEEELPPELRRKWRFRSRDGGNPSSRCDCLPALPEEV